MKTAILSLTLLLLAFCQTAEAQPADTLSIRQQNIVFIASATARGDLNNLKTSLARGLDNGICRLCPHHRAIPEGASVLRHLRA